MVFFFVWSFKLQIESSSNRFYFFFLLFSNHFSCIQFLLSSYTYFIHQDSTRCETCNILNPIFYIFIIEIKYNGFLYLLFAYNYIHLLHFNSIWIVKENIRYFSNCCCLLFLKWRFFFSLYFSLLLSRNWVLFSEDLDFLSDNFCFLFFSY